MMPLKSTVTLRKSISWVQTMVMIVLILLLQSPKSGIVLKQNRKRKISVKKDNSVSIQYSMIPFWNVKFRWHLLIFSCGRSETKSLASFNNKDSVGSEYKNNIVFMKNPKIIRFTIVTRQYLVIPILFNYNIVLVIICCIIWWTGDNWWCSY